MTEDFYNGFTAELPRIISEPNCKSIKEMHNTLKASMAEIPAILGGGANGHLGMLTTAAVYLGTQPVIPAGATVAQISLATRLHTE